MSDLATVALIGVGVLVLVPMLQRPMPVTSMPATNPVQPYPTGGVPYPPAQSEYQGYGALATGIGQGLGSLFTGISSLVNATNATSSSGY